MRTIATAALLLAAACGEDRPLTTTEAVAHLYAVSAEGVVCADAVTRDEEPERVICGWECVDVNGRLARYVFLDFAAVPAWHLASVSVEYSRSDECP
jgi:hypothetical protein